MSLSGYEAKEKNQRDNTRLHFYFFNKLYALDWNYIEALESISQPTSIPFVSVPVKSLTLVDNIIAPLFCGSTSKQNDKISADHVFRVQTRKGPIRLLVDQVGNGFYEPKKDSLDGQYIINTLIAHLARARPRSAKVASHQNIPQIVKVLIVESHGIHYGIAADNVAHVERISQIKEKPHSKPGKIIISMHEEIFATYSLSTLCNGQSHKDDQWIIQIASQSHSFSVSVQNIIEIHTVEDHKFSYLESSYSPQIWFREDDDNLIQCLNLPKLTGSDIVTRSKVDALFDKRQIQSRSTENKNIKKNDKLLCH